MQHNSEWSHAFHFNLRTEQCSRTFLRCCTTTPCVTRVIRSFCEKGPEHAPCIVKDAVFGIGCASATQRQTQKHFGHANLAVFKVIVVLTFAPLSGFWVCLLWVFMFICYWVCCLMASVTRKPEHPQSFWNPVKDTLFAAYNPCSTEPLYRLHRLAGFLRGNPLGFSLIPTLQEARTNSKPVKTCLRSFGFEFPGPYDTKNENTTQAFGTPFARDPLKRRGLYMPNASCLCQFLGRLWSSCRVLFYSTRMKTAQGYQVTKGL